jgi:hypothetical protein
MLVCCITGLSNTVRNLKRMPYLNEAPEVNHTFLHTFEVDTMASTRPCRNMAAC